uniref:Uncharacterized protein n=1 Tax=Rhizophora mucronata TaxID=61149 RepID=A0A2P2NV89_RHIMU
MLEGMVSSFVALTLGISCWFLWVTWLSPLQANFTSIFTCRILVTLIAIT